MLARNTCHTIGVWWRYTLTGRAINTHEKVLNVLKLVREDDQRFRSIRDLDQKSLQAMTRADRINRIKMRAIVRKYNWPFDTFMADEEGRTIFLVIQHATLKIQKEYLERIRHAVLLKKIKPAHLALLEDRMAIQEGRLQYYGTQVGQDMETGIWSVFPVADEDMLDERRASVGLPPMSEYVRQWDIDWPVRGSKI